MIELGKKNGFTVCGEWRRYRKNLRKKSVESFVARAISAFGEWPFGTAQFFIIGSKIIVKNPSGEDMIFWHSQSNVDWRQTFQQKEQDAITPKAD